MSTVIIALSAILALLYFGRVFFITLVIAVIIAFILEPFVSLLTRLRFPRALASFVVCSFALLILYLLGLGLYTQVGTLAEDLPKYSQRIGRISEGFLQKMEEFERATYGVLMPRRQQEREQQTQVQQARPAPPAPQTARRRRSAEPPAPSAPQGPPPVQEVRIRSERSPVIDYVYTRLSSVYETLLMASFVPFLVYFMLSWRFHIQRSFLQLFEGETRHMATQILEGIAGLARAFVVGNFVLGVLLAIASTLVFWAFKLPYAVLLGGVSGFVSLVPYIGLPLAMVPPLLACAIIYTTVAPYLIVGGSIAVFHLLALNLLYPKLVGARVHLNPLVVTVALMIWAVLWGAVGLILAIPLTAGIKAVCDNVDSLQPYGRLLGD